jgi:hypothetical protein
VLIEGESLVNDGSASVVFFLMQVDAQLLAVSTLKASRSLFHLSRLPSHATLKVTLHHRRHGWRARASRPARRCASRCS